MNTDKENLLNAIVEGSPYAKILVDQTGRITLVNAQTESLFGYSRDELLHAPIELLFPDSFQTDHPDVAALFRVSAASRPMGTGRELRGKRKDGSEVPIEIGLNPIKTDAGLFSLAAITDITERKRAEELRLLHAGIQKHAQEVNALNEQLANASRFKTLFVATMSHELRTPLTAIIGAAELLNRTALDERGQLHVQTISAAAEALHAIINSILDLSKIEAGKMELQSTAFGLETLLESAADLSAQLAREKGLTLHTYVDPAIPPLRGDAVRLRQILLNLVGNAVKFTDHGQVVARAFPVASTEREIVLRFEVQDTGSGIAPDLRGRLFEPFVQGDASATRRFGGTGLGLSISKRLVELMQGEMGVESTPGAGALFWFTARFGRALESVNGEPRQLEGVTGLLLTGDDMFAHIAERYMRAWQMETRRIRQHADLLSTLQSRADASWVAIVDVDDAGAAELAAAVEILRALLPARIITVGGAGTMRKPVRTSNLYEAIVKAAEIDQGADAALLAPPPRAASVERTTRQPVARRDDVSVLVAEDNLQLQGLLKLQFDELGIPVTFVADGYAAIEALRAGRYSMVFMDCHMPNLDGLSATRAIRANERTSGEHMRITAITANAFAEDRAECLAAGMDDYLAKPIRIASLKAALERGLDIGPL